MMEMKFCQLVKKCGLYRFHQWGFRKFYSLEIQTIDLLIGGVMIKIKAFYFLFLAVIILSSCHKKLTIAEITIGEKENNSIYRDVKKTSKKQLLNTDFFIQIKNNTIFPMEIIMVKDRPSFYGIGCHIDFKKTLGNQVEGVKLKLYPFKFGDYWFPMKLLAYKDDFIKEVLENSLRDKITISPKEKYMVKINLNKKELDEKTLRGSIWFSTDEG